VRPDQKVVLFDDWERANDRLKGATAVLRKLVRIAGEAKAA
jgi:transcription-repair coupling factor (superfamily II helicase)